MKSMKNRNILLVLLTIGFSIMAMNAVANPGFARKNGIACSTCHTAWPMLNATGRMFKENGYRLSRKEQPRQKISDNLKWDAAMPVSTLIIGRPYDKKKSKDYHQIRALHEVELFVAGNLSQKVSGFFELEAEDEDVNERGFKIGIPAASLTYNFSKAFNFQLSWADVLGYDPYNAYTGGRRLTRGSNSVISQGFGGADNGGGIGSTRQNITLYGRPIKQLFYGLSFSGSAEKKEGANANTISARLVGDVIPGVSLGAFYMDGAYTTGFNTSGDPDAGNDTDVDLGYSRLGLDLQVDLMGATLTGAYLAATDFNGSVIGAGDVGTESSNDTAFYFQALYVVRKDNRPTWVPILRYDSYTKSGGAATYNEVVAGLNYYFTENVRGMVEFWNQLDVPDGDDANNRITFQVYAAF